MKALFGVLCLLGLASLPARADSPGYWAFRPLAPAKPPVLDGDSWSKTGIDRFVLAKLRIRGLAPNKPVGRRTLIRRACFDLIGLAPTRREVETFSSDESPDAYGKLLSQLLASPHYGERWGRHWLDVARFGESHGYESDNERPSAWTYRDAVIRALNDDIPFSDFIRWQIAGDVLRGDDPLAVALTGFITSGSTVTNVDGVDREKAK